MKKNYYPVTVLAVFSVLFWCFPAYFEKSETFQSTAAQTRDLFFKIRHFSSSLPEEITDVAIVTIDEESCERLEVRWPWPRGVFASMIRNLTDQGAKVVGLNVSFTGLEGTDDASTQELAQAMRDHGQVIIGVTFDRDNRLVKPNPIIGEVVSRYGYLEKIVDPDFKIRKSYFLRRYAGKQISAAEDAFEGSFPLQVIAAWGGGSDEAGIGYDAGRGTVRVSGVTKEVPLEPDGSYTINYLASEGDFKKIPAWKVVQGKLLPDEVRGKAVLVGLTSSLFSDIHPTPLGMMPGIGVHGNEFLAAVSGRSLQFIPSGLTFLISWLVSVLVLTLLLLRRFWLGLAGFLTAVFGLFLAAQISFAGDIVFEPFILLAGPFLAFVIGVIGNSLKLLLENKGLESKVIQDKMTGLYTYEFLRLRLEDEWKRCQKAKVPLSIVMTDLDRFKHINDTLGHEVGNEMIKRAGRVIKESVRGYDIVSRYGGDEFVILLWHASFEEAKAYRQRLRDMYHAMAKKLEPALQDSSISIGIGTYDPTINPEVPADTQALVEEADKDLFKDKESRRKGPSR